MKTSRQFGAGEAGGITAPLSNRMANLRERAQVQEQKKTKSKQ